MSKESILSKKEELVALSDSLKNQQIDIEKYEKEKANREVAIQTLNRNRPGSLRINGAKAEFEEFVEELENKKLKAEETEKQISEKNAELQEEIKKELSNYKSKEELAEMKKKLDQKKDKIELNQGSIKLIEKEIERLQLEKKEIALAIANGKAGSTQRINEIDEKIEHDKERIETLNKEIKDYEEELKELEQYKVYEDNATDYAKLEDNLYELQAGNIEEIRKEIEEDLKHKADEEPEEIIDEEPEVAVEEEEPEETIDDELEVAVEEEEPEIVISKIEEARKKFVEKAREGLDEANKRKTEKNSAPETQTTSISDEPKVPTSPATEPEKTPVPEPAKTSTPDPKVQTSAAAEPEKTPTSEPKPEVQTPGPKTNVIIPEPVSHSTKSADEKTHVVKPFRIDENQKIVYGGEKVEVSKIQINGDLRKDTDTMYKLADNLINKIGGKDERYKFDDDVERKIKAYSSKYENLDDDKKLVGRQRLICGMLCEIYGIGINGDVEDYINGITADDYKSGNINKKVTDFIKDLSDGIYGTDGKKVKEQEKVYVTPNPNGKSQKTPSEPPKSKPSPNGQKTNSNPSKANNEPPRPVNSNANKQDNSDDRKLLQDITMCVMSLMIGKEIPFSSTSQKTVDKINEIVKYMKESKDLNDMNFNYIMFNQVLQKFYGLDESQAAIIIKNSGIIKDKADIFISKISHNCMLNGKKIDPECKINIAKDYTIKQWGKTWDTMALNLSNKELQKYNQEKTAQDDLEQGTELPVKAEKKGIFQRIKDALSKLKEKFTKTKEKTSDSENNMNIEENYHKNAFDIPDKTDFQEAEEVVKNVKIQNRFQRFFSNVKERFTKSNEKNSDSEKNNGEKSVPTTDNYTINNYIVDGDFVYETKIPESKNEKNIDERGD